MSVDRLPEFPARIRDAIHRSADWPTAITIIEKRTIEMHGMLPLVYRWSGIRELRDDAVAAAAVEPTRLEAVREAMSALKQGGAVALIAKGTALAYSLYPSPDLRPRGDTDLLIAAADI